MRRHCDDALKILDSNCDDPCLRAEAYICLGNASRDADSIAHFTDALNILGPDGDSDLRAQAYIGLGNAGNGKDISIGHYNKALEILSSKYILYVFLKCSFKSVIIG